MKIASRLADIVFVYPAQALELGMNLLTLNMALIFLFPGETLFGKVWEVFPLVSASALFSGWLAFGALGHIIGVVRELTHIRRAASFFTFLNFSFLTWIAAVPGYTIWTLYGTMGLIFGLLYLRNSRGEHE